MRTLRLTPPATRGRRLLLTALLAAAAIGSIEPARAEDARVAIDNFTFNPPEITVSAGSAVTWTNNDDIPHVVMASDRSFRSKPLDTGDHVTIVFADPGEYVYFCSLHPHMTGKVVVRAR